MESPRAAAVPVFRKDLLEMSFAIRVAISDCVGFQKGG
jgi:hypothetical protein